jgi:hypothetical protein
MSFPARSDYEQLIYTLPQVYSWVTSSSLRLYTISRGTAQVKGSIYLQNGLEVRVSEIIDFVAGRISAYSYTIFRGQERIRWYDPQPHPENPELASTFPHHYHTPPDIKHNRQPAPGISFTAPNFSTLIADIANLPEE